MARRKSRGPDLSELPREEQVKKAREIAYRRLGMRDYARAELGEVLAKRGLPEGVILQTLAEMEAAGYVDDARFAQEYVRRRLAVKPMSRRVLGIELRRKGISEELISAALSELAPETELAGAISLAENRLLAASGNPDTLEQRVYAMLARRGYTYEQCTKALRIARENVRAANEDRLTE
ncbi:recombination regulator RecX [Actinobaculum suis]|uniref:Regulatory protein RecX n=1 Tax=Actinobaculum suis TaxID=1657 RepID=A0A1B9BF33_9ACTO|nr:regulatory protein RecX [Actinobaculum suis]OCA96278.1 hypothetical protein ACU20_00035 [Actinobaculum suis]OCA96317.1 hypothetical protein ACU21_00035 [Actinobaculum suis]VDG76768.1 recombination regulator RecX [Actinobaculum suis]